MSEKEIDIAADPDRHYHLRRVLWWPIRIAVRWWNPPSTTVLISRSPRKDQPIDMAFSEMLTENIIAGKRPLIFFWSLSISVETAKAIIKNLQELIDQIEEFTQ